MITLPGDVQAGDNWSGYSKDPNTGASVSNKETEMGWAEHQRIVVAARGLLESLDYTDEAQGENRAKAALMLLKAAYTDADGGTVYVSKGIHQPYSDPHMQLRLEVGDETYVFHLDVSADTVVTDVGGTEHFHWRGVRFSARVRNGEPSWAAEKYDWAVWPEGVVVTPKRGRDRRDSISGPGLLARNARINEENERRREQGQRDKRRLEVLQTVNLKLKLTPKDATQKKKLWEGQPAIFLTPTKKTVTCTFADPHFTYGTQTLKV